MPIVVSYSLICEILAQEVGSINNLVRDLKNHCDLCTLIPFLCN